MSVTNEPYTLISIDSPLHIKSICSAFVLDYAPDFFFEGESHDFYEAVFVLQGRAGMTAGSEILNLREGQMIFHPPMEFHRIWNAGDESLRVLIFSFALEKDAMFDHCVRRFTPVQAQQMIDCVEIIRQRCVMRDKCVAYLRADVPLFPLFAAISKIEALFMTLLADERPEQIVADQTRSARSYTEAVSYLRENLDNRLTVDAIARHCNMSRSALQKMFLRYAGVGVMTYYHRMEVIRATELLKGGCTVKETAAALGFEDQNYFSRFYRAHTGTPPSHCRKGI